MSLELLCELERSDYPLAARLALHGRRHPEVVAILGGVNPGRVWVDDPGRPGSALIWSQGLGGFFLAGDEDNGSFLEGLGRFGGSGLDFEWFEVSGSTPAWEARIESLFAARGLKRGEQVVHLWDGTRGLPPAEEATTPGGGDSRGGGDAANGGILRGGRHQAVRYHELDRSFLAGVGAAAEGLFLTAKLDGYWRPVGDSRPGGGVEPFLAGGGRGYCATVGGGPDGAAGGADGNTVVGVCFSGFVAGRVHVIDIEVLEDYRGRGIGYGLASRLVTRLVEAGQTPYWDCMATNTASLRLAARLGFPKTATYGCYWFPLRGLALRKWRRRVCYTVGGRRSSAETGNGPRRKSPCVSPNLLPGPTRATATSPWPAANSMSGFSKMLRLPQPAGRGETSQVSLHPLLRAVSAHPFLRGSPRRPNRPG